MTIGSAISGIGGLFGSSKAADTAQSGAAQAAAVSKQMFDTGVAAEAPWIAQGAGYRAPINDVLLGGSGGTGTYAGGGVTTMSNPATNPLASQFSGWAQGMSNPFMPQANPGSTIVTTNPSAAPALSTTSSDTAAAGTPLPGGWQDSLGFGPPTTTTTSTTPTDPTAQGAPAVQGTAYPGATYGGASGGAGYGTVGLGRVNLAYNPTDWNTFASNYSMSPAAQYQMGIGDATINNSAAAKGGLLSSADLRNLMTTNQGVVSQDMFKQYGDMLQGQQQDYSQRLASLGLLNSQEALGANASNTVMSGAVSSGASQANALTAGSTAAAKDYANMFSGFGNGGANLFGSGGIFSGGGGTAA